MPSNWPPTHSASTGRNKFRSGDIPNSESPSLDSLSSYPELSRTFPQLYLEHSSNQKPPRAFPQNLPATSRNLCFFSATVFRIFKQPTWFPFAQKTQLRKSFARNLCWNFQNVLPGTYPTSNCPIAFRCRQLITSSTDSLIQITKIRRPGSACTVFFSYVASKICHKIQNPKSKIPKIQNPKSPKSKIQNPPNLGRWGHHIKICYITVQNPKSKIPKIQNPKSPNSKIQNPKSPKSKIQKPQDPKSKIRNPQIQNPKSPKFGAT